MSLKAIEWAFKQKIKPTLKLVLLALATSANEKNNMLCIPSLTRLQNDSGFDRVTVYRSINKLCDLGLVHRAKKKGRTNKYDLQLGEYVTQSDKPTRCVDHLVLDDNFTQSEPDELGDESNKLGDVCNKLGDVCNKLGEERNVEQEVTGIQRESNGNNSSKKRKKKKPDKKITYPGWLDQEAWIEFREHRKQIKKPMSVLAEAKLLNKLDKLRAFESQKNIIDRSIESGWAGLFPGPSSGRGRDPPNNLELNHGEKPIDYGGTPYDEVTKAPWFNPDPAKEKENTG